MYVYARPTYTVYVDESLEFTQSVHYTTQSFDVECSKFLRRVSQFLRRVFTFFTQGVNFFTYSTFNKTQTTFNSTYTNLFLTFSCFCLSNTANIFFVYDGKIVRTRENHLTYTYLLGLYLSQKKLTQTINIFYVFVVLVLEYSQHQIRLRP